MTEQRIAIAGIGLVGGFGRGKQAVLDALRSGGRPNGTVSVATPSGQRQLPAYQADVSSVNQFASAVALRRMNRFAKMAVLGGAMALEDAGWSRPLKRSDIGLVVASGYGASKSTFDFLDSMIDGDGRFPSPTLFSNSVHSSAASHMSIVLELEGPCLTVSQFEMSTISALLTAQQWLLEDQVEAVLFGAVEEICPVLAYCYDRFFGASACGPIEPFAWDKQTAVMGEGAAFLLLTRGRDDSTGYGYIDRLSWTQSQRATIPTDRLVVLGADGHTCYGAAYRRLSESATTRVAYTPVYGSMPGGQTFDVAIAAIAAQHELSPRQILSIKCDADGNCGIIECDFNRGSHSPV
ncbi:MAG: beta-ketoacyl synthase chain length factor [Sedimentisphaerales bacterium]|nr:beta-ketoacyl synthase chain length factor [Sedimentisphaerales bacterium]